MKVEFKPSCSNLKVFSSYLPGTLMKFVTKRTEELCIFWSYCVYMYTVCMCVYDVYVCNI